MRQPIASASYGALAAALALTAAACGTSDNPLTPNQGRVRIVLGAAESPLALPATTSDGGGTQPDSGVVSWPDTVVVGPGYPDYRPVPSFRSAKVTFSSILARNVDGVLIDVDMDLPVTVDASLLDTGQEIELPEGGLPAGTYDEVVFVVRRVEVVLWDETRVTIEPSGGGWTAKVALCPRVEVEVGGTATVRLKLQIWSALFWFGDRLHFEPQPLFWPGYCWDDAPPPIPLSR